MKEIKCLIVDDEAPARRLLEKYLSEIPHAKIVGQCKNAFEAMEAIHSGPIDLVFLDINMPKLSGLKFLESINNPPKVIICSAYKEFALESYDLDVVDYLHKPFAFERFFKAFNKASSQLQEKPATEFVIKESSRQQMDENFIFVKADKKTYKLNLSELYYVEAFGDYVIFYTSEGKITSYNTMKKLETLLPNTRFPRVHKSYIVSLSKVKSIEGNRIEVMDKIIPLGSSYKQAFMDLVNSLS